MPELSFANAFTVFMGVAAFAGTHYGLKWMDNALTDGASAIRGIVFCLAAVVMIGAMYYVVGNDLRIVAVPGASFLCCMIRQTQRIRADVRDARADLHARLEEVQVKAPRKRLVVSLEALLPGTPFHYDLQDYCKTTGLRGSGVEREALCHPIIAGLVQTGVECWLPTVVLVEA